MGISLWGIFFKIIYAVFMMALILFLAYVTTRFVGAKYVKNLRGRNISVVETVSIGLDKVLYLVKVGNEYFLISSSGKNINFLSQVDAANIVLDSENMEQGHQQFLDANSFSKYLDIFKKKVAREKEETKGNSQIVLDSNEPKSMENSITRVRDLFNNIKAPNKDGVE